jgi:hypothetical protein
MDTSNLHVTTPILWRGAGLLAVIVLIVLPFVVRLVPRQRFSEMRRKIFIWSFIYWCCLWLALGAIVFWESVYGYFFPSWARWLVPPVYGFGFAVVSWLMWWLASRVKFSPALAFVLLGSLLGPITHTIAVFRGLMDKPPMLQGASPIAAIIVSWPEFALYWCIILLLASISHRQRRAG